MLAAGVCRVTHFALAALRSDKRGKSDHEADASCGASAHPGCCAPRHGQRGLDTGTDAGTDTSSRFAEDQGSCMATPPSPRLRLRRLACAVSMRVGARMLRHLTRRGCPNEAAQQRSEFHGAPRKRPDAGLPRSAAQGSQTVGRLFFGDFLLAKQKKVTAPPGAPPGSRTRQKHAAKYCNSLRIS